MPTTEGIKKYFSLLKKLFPRGRLWNFNEQPNLKKLLEAAAVEFCRVEERVFDMLAEADPREASELLEDWETLLGIPDQCTATDRTLSERRSQIVQKLTNVGGLSADFYEAMCAQLGFNCTVENRVNFVAGRGRAGDALWNYFNRHFVAGSTAGTMLSEIGWRFFFNVEMPVSAAEVFEAGDTAGTPLREFTNPLVECTIRRLKPANAGVTFSFKG